jgi:uncharacterized OB-fold protein
VSGSGWVRSWTVIRRSFLPGFAGDLPFVLVDVELDTDNVRLVGRLLDGPAAELRVGSAVVLAFETLESGDAIPAFVLDEP